MDKKIAKNYIYSAVYRVLIVIIPLITTPYVARVLKPEGNGIYGYTNSLATLFTLFAALGFSAYGQREIAYKQDDLYGRSVVFFEICFLRAITTCIAVTAYIIFSYAFTEYTVYLLPQCMTVMAVLFDISWYYQGLENFKITVIRNLFIKIVSVACIFLFVKKDSDLVLYIVILTASNLISNILYLFSIKKYIVLVKRKDLHPLRHVRGAIEFFIPLIAVEIYSHLDRIMLGSLIPGTTESGYYEQARKVTTIIVGLIISINSVMMSRISNLYAKQEKEQIIAFYKQTFKIVLILLVPICVGLLVTADNFVVWFFGADYTKVATLLKMASLLIIFMCIGNFSGIQYLQPTGQQNKMTKAYISAALLNIALNWVLIPSFASVGAMAASIVAEIVSCGMQTFFLLRSEYRFNMLEGTWKYFLSAIMMALSIFAFNKAFPLGGVIETCINILIGLIVYFSLLYVCREENTVAIVKKTFHIKRVNDRHMPDKE